MDFLSESNLAGQTVLRLVSRGNAIIAELLRLSDYVPEVFRLETKEAQATYGNILFDYDYIKKQEIYEAKIENSAELLELDAEFRENHVEILKRFYNLFESIYKYIKDLKQYLDDLEEGVFIQLTLDSILLDMDGKQLLTEAFYLFAVMLTLMDERIDGRVRERMLVSYLRYKGLAEVPLMSEVMALCAKTGYIPTRMSTPGLNRSDSSGNLQRSDSQPSLQKSDSQPSLTRTDSSSAILGPNSTKRPKKYPVEFFSRIPIPKTVINMIIGRLRSDDIYKQISSYPLPDHRSTALATQACMLYLILYFAPDILENEQATMREIVDKHFSDNWVVSYYLGYTVDLTFVWTDFTAAKIALNNTTIPQHITDLKTKYLKKVPNLQKELDSYLTEGTMTQEFVMDSIPKLMNCARESNVTLRWLFLHPTTVNKKCKEIFSVQPIINKNQILLLLLSVAQFEYNLKNIFEILLDEKEEKWNIWKKEGSERMTELAEYFSGEKALTRVKKNSHLQQWFNDISAQIINLDYNDSTLAGRKIQQLISALQEVEQFHQIETSLQVRQFLIDTRQFLSQMIKIINIKEEVLANIEIVADISYAWQIINTYIPMMQKIIRDDPSNVLKLRATFLKLSSILDLPLVRINQANSPDLYSVSEYYSSELVDFVRTVLEIVPKSMFEVLQQIIDLQTHKINEGVWLPTKIEKEYIKDFVQLDNRFTLAKATHSISVFTEGILAMQTTLLGIIKIDPKQLLEDGIRKQLVLKIANTMDNVLQFNIKSKNFSDLSEKLKILDIKLDGFKRSFQYIQDYINIQGLKIWQEEFSRIVNFNVEQECNSFLKKKIFSWQSSFQSFAIPIPISMPNLGNSGSVNFTGRLAREILRQTNPKKTIFLDQMSSWYDTSGKELIGINDFSLLLRSVGVFGVSGLDKLYCFIIVKELQQFLNKTLLLMKRGGFTEVLNEISNELHPTTTIPKATIKGYSLAIQKTKPLTTIFGESVSVIGQIQLIRRQIANLLNYSCKLDSNMLSCTLDVMNLSLLKDIESHYENPEEKIYPGDDDNPILAELAKYLETTGIHDPYSKIYVTSQPIDDFPLLVFLYVISNIQKFTYDQHLSIIKMNKKEQKTGFDGAPFVVGVITLLKQFHSKHTQQFLAYLGQYIRSFLNITASREKTTEYATEVISAMYFLEDYCKFSGTSRKIVESYIPSYVFNNFKH